ncbi:MAG: hydroxysqualene dehydroxylase HpnE [Pseudomonadota bacterium]
MPSVHVIGAGLAGLAAAVRLAAAGWDVALYEAAGRAGGRCRSFHDKHLGLMIDNGNHLVLSGNSSAMAFLDEVGARHAMIGPERAVFPFIDIATGERWRLELGAGPIPWWVADRARRVPGTSLADYLSAARLVAPPAGVTVADRIRTDGVLYKRFWEPLTLAALNTSAERGQARLLWAVLKETFLKGEAACRPLIAKEGLGPSFVDPALAFLGRAGARVEFNRRLRAVQRSDGRIAALDFGVEKVELAADDKVVLALPPSRAKEIFPELDPPEEGEVIVNAHYVLDAPVEAPDGAVFMGLINARAHWVFVRENVVSVTISAAGDVGEEDAAHDELIPALWREVAMALALGGREYEAARIIKEKRATFDQSPAGVARRLPAETAIPNLVLAGDWTDTKLPATIEGAIRSGHTAAAVLAPRRTA